MVFPRYGSVDWISVSGKFLRHPGKTGIDFFWFYGVYTRGKNDVNALEKEFP
jgi:hypothetical protein